MTRHVYVFLTAEGQWHDWTEQRGNGAFHALGDDYVPGKSETVIAIVPGTETALHRVTLPNTRRADQVKAAGFAIEDDLAAPIERHHLALGQVPNGGGATAVSAVLADQMQIWADAVAALGVSDSVIVPDTALMLDADFGLDVGAHVLLPTADSVMAVDNDLPRDALAALAGDQMNRLSRPDRPIEVLARLHEDQAAVLNLLQGDFGPRRQIDVSFDHWRSAAALVALAGALWLGATGLETRALGALEASTQDRIAEATARIDPDIAPPTNISAARALSGVSAGQSLDFVDAAAGLYGAIAKQPGAGLQSLRFDRSDGELTARITYTDFGQDLTLKQSLEAAGVSVTLGDARSENGQVVGDLTVRGAP